MPMEKEVESASQRTIFSDNAVSLMLVSGLSHPCLMIKASAVDAGEELFEKVFAALDIPEGEPEPMLNVLCLMPEYGLSLYSLEKSTARIVILLKVMTTSLSLRLR